METGLERRHTETVGCVQSVRAAETRGCGAHAQGWKLWTTEKRAAVSYEAAAGCRL